MLYSSRKAEASLRARQKFRLDEEHYFDIIALETHMRCSYNRSDHGLVKRWLGFVPEDTDLSA